MRTEWMTNPVAEYQEELAEDEGTDYDTWIYDRMFPGRDYQSRRDWWSERGLACMRNPVGQKRRPAPSCPEH